jgi:FG-GAP repeat
MYAPLSKFVALLLALGAASSANIWAASTNPKGIFIAPPFNVAAELGNPLDGPSDGSAFDQFGQHMAYSGNTLVIGVPRERVGDNKEQGAVYVYARSGATWVRQAKIADSATQAFSHFGESVSIYGDTLVVGSYSFDPSSPTTTRASIYVRVAGVWQLQATLLPPKGPLADPAFGRYVAVYGDSVIVGAPGLSDNAPGRAFFYQRSGVNWQLISDLQGEKSLGEALAIDGNVAVVGAADSRAISGQIGAAYVLELVSGSWVIRDRLQPTSPGNVSAVNRFGFSVAIAGQSIVVGAPGSTVTQGGVREGQGAAFAFVRQGNSWVQESVAMLDPGGDADDLFGASVAIRGDRALIGAYGDEDGSPRQFVGSAMIFTRDAGNWMSGAPLRPEPLTDIGSFGAEVELADDIAIIGAPRTNYGSLEAYGTVFRFDLQANSWVARPQLYLPDGASFDRFGWSIAVDGDTAIVGAPFQDVDGRAEQGAVYVYRQRNNRWEREARLVSNGLATGEWFGISVALKGDTAVIGARHADVGGVIHAGAVYVFRRTGTSWTQQQILSALQPQAYAEFGNSVAIDSITGRDILVGSWLEDFGSAVDSGTIYHFSLTAGQWVANDVARFIGNAGDLFGFCVSIANNIWAVGAPGRDVGGRVDQGGASIIEINPGVGYSSRTINVPTSLAQPYMYFGYSVATSGLGNPNALVFIGAPYADVNGAVDAGEVFRVSTGGDYVPQAMTPPAQLSAGYRLGYVGMSAVGSHLLVGAPGAAIGGQADAGAAFFYPNSDASAVQFIRARRTHATDFFGFATAIGPLVNGYPAWLLIGAPNAPGASEFGNVLSGEVSVLDTDTLFADGFSDPIN